MTEPAVFPQKHALLIGINHYPKLAARYQLHGCVNDVRSMKSVLIGSFGFQESNVKVLEDAAATREAILQELAALTGRVGENAVVVVHYSGHGSQRTDLEGDEASGLDSTIVPHDSGRTSHPNLDITDDEIHDWLSQMALKTPFTTLIFDCCHSGTIARDPFGDTERWAEPDLRSKEEIRAELDQRGERRRDEGKTKGKRGRSGWFPIDKSYTLIAGCADEESSFEMPISDRNPLEKQGALTFHLVREMLKADPGTTYRDVFERVRRDVSIRYARQHPQMEGVPDRQLFGVTEIRPLRFVQVQERSGAIVVIAAGTVHGLARGAQWAIYSQGSKSDASEEGLLGMVEVVEVGGVSATARVIEENGRRSIQVGDRAVEKVPVIGAWSLLVDIAPAPVRCEQAVQELTERLAASGLLRLAGPEEAALALARVYLVEPRTAVPVGAPLPELGQLSAHTWAVAGRDGRLLTPAHPLDSRVDGRPVVEVIVENLEKISSYLNRLSLTNPDRNNPLVGMVEFNLLHLNEYGTWEKALADPQTGHIVYTSEDKIALEVTNYSDKALYISLLDFGQNQSIELLYPPDRPSERLEANITMKIWAHALEMEVYIDDDYPYDEDIETYKLIVTNQPVDLTWLEQEAARGSMEAEGQERTQENSTLFEQLYQQASLGTRGTRLMKPAPGETWITIERSFLARKKSAAQPGASSGQ